MSKIIVDSQELKNKILSELEYVLRSGYVDTTKASTLRHFYTNPDLIEVNKTKMSKELTLNERYIIAQSMDDFENTWNDHTEFDDMEVPRLRSELTEEQLKLLNQTKDD